MWFQPPSGSRWFPLRALKARFQLCCRQRGSEQRACSTWILSCPVWLFFVLIPVRIHSVCLCSCRLCVSRGLPRDAAVIRALLFLPMLSFLSCVWCWFCVWFCYPWLCMLLVIMLIEGLILKAADLRRSCIEDQSWQATKKKTRTSFFVFPSGCVSKNVLAGKQDPHHSPHPRLYIVLYSSKL